MNDTFGDKLADQFPMWLWPKIRIPYYVFSAIFLLLMCLGMIAIVLRGALAH